MRIDEPKTPYQQAHSLRSPEALQLDGASSSSAPRSPNSTNGAAGTLPSELSLGDRMTEISNAALQRREHEWESDQDEEEESNGPLDAAASSHAAAASASAAAPAGAGHRSNQSSMSSGGVSGVHHVPLHAHSHPHIETSSDPDLSDGGGRGSRRSSTSSAEESLEQKHREFEAKRAGNYHSMGALLRAKKAAAAEQDEDE
jgi:hypothetical protein